MRNRNLLIGWAFALTTAAGVILGFEAKFFVSIEPRDPTGDPRRPSRPAGSCLGHCREFDRRRPLSVLNLPGDSDETTQVDARTR